MDLTIADVIQPLWFMLPAYIANPAAVIFKGKTPMDFGKKFIDGRRILGKGKTWRGFFGGAFSGIVVGLIQNFVSVNIKTPLFPPFSYSLSHAMLIISLLSFGAMLGDAVGSFIKRRLGIESGGKAFLLDQLGFVLMAWFLLYIIANTWFSENFLKPVPVLVILVLTPVLHRVVNIIAYKMGKKSVPW